MYNGNKERLNTFLNLYTNRGREDKCWIWTGSIDKNLGYGRTSFIGSPMTAHRVTYILAYGDYLSCINGRKTCIRHLCNNKLCINPKHLALGTHSDNGRDRSMAGAGVKMTLKKLKSAVKLRNDGMTYKNIGKVIGVGEVVVSMAINGKTYYCREMLKDINNERR